MSEIRGKIDKNFFDIWISIIIICFSFIEIIYRLVEVIPEFLTTEFYEVASILAITAFISLFFSIKNNIWKRNTQGIRRVLVCLLALSGIVSFLPYINNIRLILLILSIQIIWTEISDNKVEKNQILFVGVSISSIISLSAIWLQMQISYEWYYEWTTTFYVFMISLVVMLNAKKKPTRFENQSDIPNQIRNNEEQHNLLLLIYYFANSVGFSTYFVLIILINTNSSIGDNYSIHMINILSSLILVVILLILNNMNQNEVSSLLTKKKNFNLFLILGIIVLILIPWVLPSLGLINFNISSTWHIIALFFIPFLNFSLIYKMKKQIKSQETRTQVIEWVGSWLGFICGLILVRLKTNNYSSPYFGIAYCCVIIILLIFDIFVLNKENKALNNVIDKKKVSVESNENNNEDEKNE